MFEYSNLKDTTLFNLRNALGFNSNVFWGSTVINSKLFNDLYLGQPISQNTINSVSNHLLNLNTMGGEATVDLSYRVTFDSLFKKRKIEFIIGLRDRNHFDLRFSHDLFNLVFYGNERFAGQSANLSGFNFHLLQYQSIQFGYHQQVSNRFNYGILISFINGQNDIEMNSPYSTLYTDPLGESINLSSQMNYNYTNLNTTNLGVTNGEGFGLDAFIGYSYIKKPLWEESFNCSLKDIGFIHWNSHSTSAKIDSNYNFSGVTLNSLFSIQSGAIEKLNSDSILNKLIKKTSTTYTTLIPGSFDLNSITQFKKWKITKGVNYIFNANYRLNYYMTGAYAFTNNYLFIVGASYGGYTNLSIIAGLKAYLSRNLVIQLNSTNVLGFITPSSSLGQSLSVMAVAKF